MFCRNCGKNLSDNAKFCDGCGTRVDTAPAPASQPSISTTPPLKRNKKTLSILIGSVAAVVVIAVGIIVGVNIAGNKPEKIAEKFATAAITADPQAYVNCMPDFMIREIAEEISEEMDFGVCNPDKKSVANYLKTEIDPEDFGTIKIYNTQIDFDSDYTMEDVRDIAEDRGATSFDLMQIEEFKVVEIDALINGEGETASILCIKMDGKWYAIDFNY